jgi:hypothetical protein
MDVLYKLNLLDITSNFCTVDIFVIASLQTICDTQCLQSSTQISRELLISYCYYTEILGKLSE